MLEIRKGTIRDTEPLIDLMVLVRQSMEHKEWLYLDPPDEVRRMMNDGTMSLWVSMDGKRMAGAYAHHRGRTRLPHPRLTGHDGVQCRQDAWS